MRYSVLIIALGLMACATPGIEQRGVLIEAASSGQALEGTPCTVSTASGSWNVVTPTVVDVGDPNGDLRVVCNRAGYRTSESIHRAYATGSTGSPIVGLGVGGGSRGSGASIGLNFPVGGWGGGARYPSRIRVELTPL